MPPHRMMSGHIVFRFSVRGYICMNVRPSEQMCVHTYVHDPVRLGLRHLKKPTDLDLHCLPLSM